jgi:hypothetical protein
VFWTPRWLLRHALAATLIGSFLALGWWQVRRAAGGNTLSYAYAVEWPVFAGFVAFVWYQEIRRARARAPKTGDGTGARPPEPAGPPPVRSTRQARRGPAYDDSDDAQLAAYNRYLAWRAAHPDARLADYREDS